MYKIDNLEWKQAGTLSHLKTIFGGGVYIWIYEQSNYPNRIIYVGKADIFMKRWGEHLALFQEGKRTIWRPEEYEDIYDLITIKRKENEEKPEEKKYISLSNNKKLFIPDNPYKLNLETEFDKDWNKYLLETYFPKIQLWYCKLNEKDLKYSTYLESKLQKTLRKKYGISNWKNISNNSWVGKIEHTNEEVLKKFEFEFVGFPDIGQGNSGLFDFLNQPPFEGLEK